MTVNRSEQLREIIKYLENNEYDIQDSVIYLHPHFYNELVPESKNPTNLYFAYSGFIHIAQLPPDFDGNVWVWESKEDNKHIVIYSGDVYKKLDKEKKVGDNK